MIIAQISDTHIEVGASENQKRIDDFENTVADIVSLTRQPDLIIHTGDIAHNGKTEEYEIAREILEKTHLPYFTIPGNRDDRQYLLATFSNSNYSDLHSEFIQYQIKGFPVALVMLDTVSLESNRGEYCNVRSQHLSALAERTDSKPTLIFSHHPPFDANDCPDPFQFTSHESRNQVVAGLEEFTQMKALICGHVHRFDTGTVCDRPAYAMPSTATNLRWGDYPPAMVSKPVYQIIEVAENETISVQTRLVQPI